MAETTDEQWKQERELVLSEYGTWRLTADDEAPVAAEVSTLETLLRLKAEQLESADPTYWTEELIGVLLTQVVPRKVVQPREMAMAQAPALGQFFGFLQSHGRWHRESIPVPQARKVLEGLEFSVVEAADDPTRRSFSGNIFTYANSLGVGLEDPGQLDAFMQWYNTELTDAERHEVSDTGRLADPKRPFDAQTSRASSSSGGASARGTGSAFFPDPPDRDGSAGDGDWSHEAVPDDAPAPSWPWFLPDENPAALELSDEDLPDDDPAALTAVHAEVPLVQRAVRLLEFVGEGRQVTSTGALRLADVRTLLEEWGIDPGPRRLTTMWQIGEIVGPWTALAAGGWITLTSTRVRPGDQPLEPCVSAQEDPEAFTLFARAILTILLLSWSEEDAEDGGMQGGADTIAALLYVTGPHGLTLPEPLSEGLDGQDVPRGPDGMADIDALIRLWHTSSDLNTLTAYGYLQREQNPSEPGEHFQANVAVMAAVAAVLEMKQGLADQG